MARLFLKPDGLKIPSPDHQGVDLPAGGDWVNTSTYWQRRLADGDVSDDTDEQLKREAAEEQAAAKRAKTPKES